MQKLYKEQLAELIHVMQASDEGFTTKEIRTEVRGEKERLSRYGCNIFV